MDGYRVRIGTRRAKKPAKNLYGIPCRTAVDDGKTLLHAGHGMGDFSPVCPDCGTGILQWAEGGFVPWHRICDTCGSHWDLHPIGIHGIALAGNHLVEVPGRGPYSRKELLAMMEETVHDDPESLSDDELRGYLGDWAEPTAREHRTVAPDTICRWAQGRGLILLDPDEKISEECPYTWGDLVALTTPEMWEAAEKAKDRLGGIVTLMGCAWARRARFY